MVHTIKSSIKYSWKISVFTVFLSGITFGIIDSINLVYYGDFDFILYCILFITIITAGFSIFPAIISGAILTNKIQNDIDHNLENIYSSMMKGAELGGICAFLIASLIISVVYELSFYATHLHLTAIQFIRVAIVIIIGIVAGGLTGRQLHLKLIKQHPN